MTITKWLNTINKKYFLLVIQKPIIKPYYGLSLEDHIFENTKFPESNFKKLIILWRNNPSVILGKFQNPWIECNVNYCNSNNIYIARRSSGGGTVFHDPKNLNISVFSNKKFYNRKENLEIACDTLIDLFPKKLEFKVNERDDLLLNNKKISGSAARLNGNNSYHHFTLLIDSDRNMLKNALDSKLKDADLKTNATKSVPAKTVSILQEAHNLNFNSFTNFDTAYNAFYDKYKTKLHVQNEDIFEIDSVSGIDDISRISDISENSLKSTKIDKFYNFEEIQNDVKNRLETYEWIYGRTPKFTYRNELIEKGRFKSGELFVA